MKHFNKKLLELRRQIDVIDRDLLRLMARRMGVSKKIGRLKVSARVPVVQKVRWSSLMANRKKLAKKLRLEIKLVDGIFRLIQKESISVQKKVRK